VPGAAATLTRSINTPIPTPVRTPAPSVSASPSASRVAVPAVSSPSPVQQAATTDTDVANIQNQMEQVVATPALTGIEALLLDHVSLSTPQGGQVMDTDTAAAWLRDHAGPGIKVTQVELGTQDVMLGVDTVGWPVADPLQSGQVSFSLRRYDANGRQDESGGGTWKIDVIEAE
jgi:hypothetical protein